MFNPFKKLSKSFKPISEYPENWSIIEELRNPTIIRINMGYKDAIGHPDYPIKVGIAIPVEDHDDVTMSLKSEIEDILEDVLFKTGSGALVAIITGLEGQKFIEFLSYTKRGGIDFPKIHQDLKNKFKDYEIQMYADNDPKWDAYKSFAHI
jgi:hypothetical protein